MLWRPEGTQAFGLGCRNRSFGAACFGDPKGRFLKPRPKAWDPEPVPNCFLSSPEGGEEPTSEAPFIIFLDFCPLPPLYKACSHLFFVPGVCCRPWPARAVWGEGRPWGAAGR